MNDAFDRDGYVIIDNIDVKRGVKIWDDYQHFPLVITWNSFSEIRSSNKCILFAPSANTTLPSLQS